MCERAVRMHSGHEKFRTPCGLLLPMPSIPSFIPDHLKTREMCEKAVEKNPWELDDVPDHFKAQEMCNEAVRREPWLLKFVPDRFKTQEMCNKAVHMDPWLPNYVPDWFVAQQQVRLWDDNYYNDDAYIK